MDKLKWTTVQRKVSGLECLSYNPRKWKDSGKQQLTKSMDEFGLVEIPVINIDNTLIAGHRRIELLIANGDGEKLIDVRIPNRKLSEEEIKKYNILSNTHAGIWDVKILEESFADIDLTGLGVDPDHLAALKKQSDLDIELVDLDVEDPLPAYHITALGDLYVLKNKTTGVTHRVLCGDSTDQDQVDRLMDSNLADLSLIDPPYNVAYEGQNGMKIKNDEMDDASFYEFLKNAFNCLYQVTKSGGCLYVAHAESQGTTFRRAYIDSGFLLKQLLVWLKNSAVLSRQDYNWQHEPIIYGWKPGAAHYFVGDFTQKTLFEESENLKKKTKADLVKMIEDFRKSIHTSAIKENRPTINDLHPTMKPVKLWGRLIINSARRGEIVLDTFLGSGTTLIACEQTGRICYGMDLDQCYIDRNILRWVNWMKLQKMDYEIELNGEPISELKLNNILCQNKETSSRPNRPSESIINSDMN